MSSSCISWLSLVLVIIVDTRREEMEKYGNRLNEHKTAKVPEK
jgi:hypothetical protein